MIKEAVKPRPVQITVVDTAPSKEYRSEFAFEFEGDIYTDWSRSVWIERLSPGQKLWAVYEEDLGVDYYTEAEFRRAFADARSGDLGKH